MCRLSWIELGFHEDFYAELYSAVVGSQYSLDDLLVRSWWLIKEFVVMKIIRYQDSDGRIGYAERRVDGGDVKIDGDIFSDFTVSTEKADVKKLLAPVIPPTILCIGLNYRFHAKECGSQEPEFPVLFIKNAGAVQNPDDPILIPKFLESREVDYECELVVVIGKTCKNVCKAEALDYVLGYTCGNDVSARDWQKKWGGGQWCRGKSFDTFAPLGPCIVTADEISNPNDLAIKTTINGGIMQDCNTKDMIFDVPTLIEFLSGSTTLAAGTVILTGTPHGVGMARKPPVWLKAGDAVTVEIEKIGALSNPVLNEAV